MQVTKVLVLLSGFALAACEGYTHDDVVREGGYLIDIFNDVCIEQNAC